MSKATQELQQRIEEFYITSTGRLSHPMCEAFLESEYPALVEELKRLNPEVSSNDTHLLRLEQARDNIKAQLERYETINKRWNKEFSPPDLRRHLA
jgi:hypothetical protein